MPVPVYETDPGDNVAPESADRQGQVTQTLLDAEGDHDWGLKARVDLRRAAAVDQPLLRLEWIGR